MTIKEAKRELQAIDELIFGLGGSGDINEVCDALPSLGEDALAYLNSIAENRKIEKQEDLTYNSKEEMQKKVREMLLNLGRLPSEIYDNYN